MKAITKASRINAVLQVIQYMNCGMTIVEACREVGMARSGSISLKRNTSTTLIRQTHRNQVAGAS